MMALWFFLDAVSSITVILACWWLAHQYGAMKTRYRRLMSIVYALLGITVLLSMMFRLAGLDPVAGGVIVKMLITCILIYVVLFIRRNYDIG
ncbi:hypothetical protein [Pararhizobium haloflavum]|uniref:hypothetical protein n=1 Tax=Pararhizobium haloflavum TaxID=2037914 RepID=UPI000C1A5420|nr:hypothetical protein [Pararhizobium haloflavum]